MIVRNRPVTKWAVLAIAGALAGVSPTVVPAASADSGGYAVTRVQVSRAVYSVAADPTTNTVYAIYAPTSLVPTGIAVINGATNKVSATISLGFIPEVVAADPASDTVYAFGGHPSTAAVINGATNTVTATISMPSGAGFYAAAVNPATHMVYATDILHAAVIAINGSTRTVTSIPIADPVSAPHAFTRGIAVDTATNQVYVADSNDDQVAVIDGTTNTVTSRITMPARADPAGLAVDPGAGKVYVADQGTSAVSVIAAASGTVTTTITGMASVQGPLAVAVDPGNGRLYVTARWGGNDPALVSLGNTYVVDTASQAIITQIPRGGSAITMDTASDGSAYIATGTAGGGLMGSVTKITPSTASTMAPVIVGSLGFAFTTGHAGHSQLEASSTPAANFSAIGLPPGLTLSPGGLLSGTPAPGTGGFYDIPVTAANGVAPPDNELIYLSIYQPASITSVDHATFRTRTAGTFTVTTSGFPAATFSETGALPNGVTLSPAGVLSGTPARGTGGPYHIKLTAFNNVASPATQAFTLTVQQPPSFASPDEVTFKAGVRKSFTIVAHGFPAPHLAETGKLPKGIAFKSRKDGTATLSGMARRHARGRTFKVVITASNGVGATVHQALTIRIR